MAFIDVGSGGICFDVIVIPSQLHYLLGWFMQSMQWQWRQHCSPRHLLHPPFSSKQVLRRRNQYRRYFFSSMEGPRKFKILNVKEKAFFCVHERNSYVIKKQEI